MEELSSKIDKDYLYANLDSKIRENNFTEDEYEYCNRLFNRYRIFGGDKLISLSDFSIDDYHLEEKRDKYLDENKELIKQNFKLIEKYLLKNDTLLLYFGIHYFWRIKDNEIYDHLIINLKNNECDNEEDMMKNKKFKNCVDFWLVLMYRDYGNYYTNIELNNKRNKTDVKIKTFVEYMEDILEKLKVSNESNTEFYGYGSSANTLKRYIFSK